MFGREFEIAMREFLSMGGFFHVDGQVTFAIVPLGNTIEVATSVCSDHDTFNESVGECIALERFDERKTIYLPADWFDNNTE